MHDIIYFFAAVKAFAVYIFIRIRSTCTYTNVIIYFIFINRLLPEVYNIKYRFDFIRGYVIFTETTYTYYYYVHRHGNSFVFIFIREYAIVSLLVVVRNESCRHRITIYLFNSIRYCDAATHYPYTADAIFSP